MQDPNAPYQSVGQTTGIPVNQSPYQQPMQPPYQGQPEMYQQKRLHSHQILLRLWVLLSEAVSDL